MVFVTHDQDEALSIADRVAVMSGGRIEQFADPETLYARPETSFVAGFVGSMNFFQGRLSPNGVVIGEGAVFVPCGQRCFAGLAGADGNWEVAVRPEDVVVTLVGGRPRYQRNACEAGGPWAFSRSCP